MSDFEFPYFLAQQEASGEYSIHVRYHDGSNTLFARLQPTETFLPSSFSTDPLGNGYLKMTVKYPPSQWDAATFPMPPVFDPKYPTGILFGGPYRNEKNYLEALESMQNTVPLKAAFDAIDLASQDVLHPLNAARDLLVQSLSARSVFDDRSEDAAALIKDWVAANPTDSLVVKVQAALPAGLPVQYSDVDKLWYNAAGQYGWESKAIYGFIETAAYRDNP